MGLFVVFEGIEGSGKSTQSRALKRRLDRAGYPATLVHEPGGTPIGERLRRWVKGDNDINPMGELFLFSAARASLVESVLRPSLRDNHTVICDRYIYSTVAYQSYGRGLDLDTVQRVNAIASGGLEPDLVVLLDIAPEEGLARKAAKRLDRFEREDQAFHRRVRDGYLALAQQDPERWLVVDSSRSKASLSETIWVRIERMLRGQPKQIRTGTTP